MGVLDHLFGLCSFTNTKKSVKRRSRRPLQTVDVKVKMDCDGCERRVRHAVCSLRGVTSVNIDRKQSRVTVKGYVEPSRVLKKVKSTGKHAEIWPYVPYNLVHCPYASGVYDSKAPTGYVRKPAQGLSSPNALEEKYTWLFNDENANACTIM